jgi:hypothetical protein
MKQTKDIETRGSESASQQVCKKEGSYIYQCLCFVCERQFILKTRDAVHVCNHCQDLPLVDLRERFFKLDEECEDIKAKLAFRSSHCNSLA